MSFFKRDISEFQNRDFDLLVIGSGINGLGIAWDASLRGLRVAVIDKDDFGGQTSAACFNIIHGGIRYLQHLDIKRLRKSVREQKILRQIAPKIVNPLPLIVPCYKEIKKSRNILRLGMFTYESLALDRNYNVAPQLKLSAHKLISRDELMEYASGLDSQGLDSGVIFYDCQMSSSERFTLQVAKAAKKAGAAVANYLEFIDVIERNNSHAEVLLFDKILNQEVKLTTKFIVNATGPSYQIINDKIMSQRVKSTNTQRKYVKGIQFVFNKHIGDLSVAVESRFKDKASKISRGGRSFFIVPWQGYTLVGTYEIPVSAIENFTISEQEIANFLREFQEIYQDPSFCRENLVSSFGGYIPLESINAESSYKVARDDEIHDHTKDQNVFNDLGCHLVSVIGVKYTTFRALSEKVVDLVLKKLKLSQVKCKTHLTPIDSDLEDFKEIKQYSELSKEIIVNFVENEMAMNVDDIINRRTIISYLNKKDKEQESRVEQIIKEIKDR